SNGIEGKCGGGKVGKLKTRRAGKEGAIIVALPLGRTVLVAPEPSAAAPNPTDAANNDVPTPAVADSPAPRAPKKVRKASRRTGGHDWSREWSLPASQWSARAYSPHSRYLRGRYEQAWGRSWEAPWRGGWTGRISTREPAARRCPLPSVTAANRVMFPFKA